MISQDQLNEACATMRGHWQDAIGGNGDHCPVCDRWGKINTVVLRSIMVKTMHWIHHKGGGDWVDVPGTAPRFVSRSYSFSKLKYWGLVEQRHVPPLTMEERKAGIQRETRNSGMWKLTPQGVDFIFNGTVVPEKLFVYNDQRVGAGDKLVTARECSTEHFNYDAMMGSTFNGDYDELDYD